MCVKAFILGVLSFGAAACSAGAPSQATSVSAPHASFDRYASFSFGLVDAPQAGYQVTSRTLEVQQHLQPVVKADLQRVGYVFREEGGDLVVRLVTGMTPKLVSGGSADSFDETRVTPARGYIGINIYDRATGSMVWQGSASAEINPDRIDDALLQRGAAHLLANFPKAQSSQVASVK